MNRHSIVLVGLLCLLSTTGVVGCDAGTTDASSMASVWVQLDPSGDVPRGGPAAAVYDSLSGRVIVCGAWDFGMTFDIRVYDPEAGSWADISGSDHAPVGRSEYALAYLNAGKMLLFGGSFFGQDLNDTWVYDVAAEVWTEQKPAGEVPRARMNHAMAYDEESGRVILFGGLVGEVFGYEPLPAGVLGDTWSYDVSADSWTQMKPEGATPQARWGHTLVYDPVSDKVMLFGGSCAEGVADDLWAYDLATNTWTQLHPAGDTPCGRCYHSMVYVAATGCMILFGGAPGPLDDTWAYEPGANAWAEVCLAGERPPARSGHAMVYDPASGALLLFAGIGGDELFRDTWTHAVEP